MKNLFNYIPKNTSTDKKLDLSNNKYIYKEYNNELMYYPKDITYNEAVELLIRQKYSLSDELAILRQQEEKVSEYNEYYDYAEQCKVDARDFIVIKENWNN